MPRERGQRRIAARWFCIPIGFFLAVLAVPLFLFFRQHAMIYHPRPYDSRYGVKLPANGVEINYTVSAGKCSAFYIPSREVLPKRLWIAFCGNGSLALDFAARHRVERVGAIAPFTTLREEAARVVGRQLARLLRENYDNRKNLAQIARHNPKARIGIFHGTADDDIPVEMGRELVREFPFVEFFAIDGADHVSVLDAGHDKIVDWMNH